MLLNKLYLHALVVLFLLFHLGYVIYRNI